MIQKPSCDMEHYLAIVNRGLERFPKRKENYMKFQQNRDAGFRSDVDYMPVKMDYDVSSTCNFRCKMCLMSEVSGHRPPNMTFENFKKSIDEQYGLVEVKLQGLGEPLLCGDFFKMAEYVVSRDIWTRTTTNASLLHRDDAYKRLIDVGLGEIQISIDGATKAVFESIRVGSDFEQIVKNVKLLNDYAEKKGELWKTSCWMMVQKENMDEMEAVLRLAASLKFTRFTYQMSMSDFGKDNWKLVNGEKTVNHLVSPERMEYLTDLGGQLGVRVGFWDNQGNYREGERCAWPFSRAYITADMEVSPCCLYWDQSVCNMGSALNFERTWTSETYRQFRSAFLNGRVPDICRHCYGLEG